MGTTESEVVPSADNAITEIVAARSLIDYYSDVLPQLQGGCLHNYIFYWTLADWPLTTVINHELYYS